MSRRKRSEGPQPLTVELRAYRLESARLAYASCSESVRRLADLILENLTGLSFPKIASEIERYHSRMAETIEPEQDNTEPADETSQDEQPDSSQDSLDESAPVDTLEPASGTA
jgi:hypothetical protein